MPEFRKKEPIVKAVQWWPPEDPRHDEQATPLYVSGFTRVCDRGCVRREVVSGQWAYRVYLGDSWQGIAPGDWIVSGPRYEVWPDKSFRERFEAVAESDHERAV